MAKVAYNDDFGGFELPRILKGEERSDGSISEDDYGFIDSKIPRHDSVLVEVIEKVGGRAGSLRLRELPTGTKYFIDEHGGSETVETIDSIEWIIAT